MPWNLWQCNKPLFPPTDAGVPAGLPPLPFGFHYAQTSTDRVTADGTHKWRARAGMWAKDRGNIYVAPWIQSTETIIVVWDGIKRSWQDDEEIDDDPLLSQAIEEYVRWRHEDKYGHDAEEASRAGGAFALAKQALIHQCREETRARECEPSYARSSVTSLKTSTLFYNEAQTATAACQDGSHPVSVTIPAGAVTSTISVADANQKAKSQAQSQANAQLNCPSPPAQTFKNTEQKFTANCASDGSHPPPDGAPVTVIVPAGTFTSDISQADADNQALAQAQFQAGNQIKGHCTWWNAEQTVTLTCPTDSNITASYTVPVHSISSTVNQDDADAKALAAANSQATTALNAVCLAAGVFWNTPQSGQVRWTCPTGNFPVVLIDWTIAAHFVSAPTQVQANESAISYANGRATLVAQDKCTAGNFGPEFISLP